MTDDDLATETGKPVPQATPITVGLPEGTLDDGHSMELPDPDAVPGDAHAAQRELAAKLHTCLPSLPGHEGEIVRLHFGLNGDEALTTRDIGRELRLSERQVQHLLKSALARLAVMLSPDAASALRTTRLVQ